MSTSALPLSSQAAPAAPADVGGAVELAGLAFADGPLPSEPGVLVVALPQAGRLYPLLIETVENLEAEAAATIADLPPLPAPLRLLWLARSDAQEREQIAQNLARVYNPPLEAEHRTAAAAAEIAEFVPDLAAARFPSPPADGGVKIEEAALHRLVEDFYAASQRDPLLGPIFSTAIGDWDRHISLMSDFWSRALTGTARYQGFPFGPHVRLELTPEHFERWVSLFAQAAERALLRRAAARAIAKASSMSRSFQAGLYLEPGPAG